MQSVTKNMHIRKLEPSDLEQYNDLLRYAFQVTEKTLLECGWEDDDIRQSKFPVLERANVLGWFDGGRLVSQIAVYPMRMNIHGSALDMGFITSVATYPEYTGMGLMSSLMKRCLDEMCGLGQSISLLYPYSIPLYRHKGWELVSDKMAFRVKDHQLPRKLSVPGYVRRVAHNSIDLIKAARAVCQENPRLHIQKRSGLGRILALGRRRHDGGYLLHLRWRAVRLHGVFDQG